MRRLRQLLFLVLTLLLGPASPFLWAKAPPSSSRRASMVGSRRQQQLVGRASPHAAPAAAATAAHEVEEGEEERRLWQELSSLVAGPVEMAPLPAKPSSTSALDTLESAFPLRKLERLRDAGDPVALMAAVRSAAAGVWATMTNAGQQIEQRDGGGKVPSYFEAKGRGGQYRPRRRATKREAMMGMAVELFLSLLVDAGAEEGSSSGGNPLAPNSWCFTASVEALVRGAR